MRELNECKAEVFRRSEKRIKERKKNRNGVLAWCLPLVLCVTVWSVTLLPEMMSVGSNDTKQESRTGISKPNVRLYVRAEIQDIGGSGEYYHKVTDVREVTEIFSALHNLCDVDRHDVDGTEAEENDSFDLNKDIQDETEDSVTENFSTANPAIADEYMITLTAADDSERTYMHIYVLKGDELFDKTDDMRIRLSVGQLSELKTVLGLTR